MPFLQTHIFLVCLDISAALSCGYRGDNSLTPTCKAGDRVPVTIVDVVRGQYSTNPTFL